MKYTDIKIGDKIKINICPAMWNSHLGGKDPVTSYRRPPYPFEGIVEKMDNVRYPLGVAVISGYGFALEYILDYELLNTFAYEIY